MNARKEKAPIGDQTNKGILCAMRLYAPESSIYRADHSNKRNADSEPSPNNGDVQ